jgi:hypothetical protein
MLRDASCSSKRIRTVMNPTKIEGISYV